MPINDSSAYPPDWPAISRRIREREGNRCKFCGVEQYALGWRDRRGAFHKMVTEIDCEKKVVRVVLTVAHLDHDPSNNSEDNLAALCQRCHLLHDIDQHRHSAAATRRFRKRCAGQMEFPC